MPKLKITSAIAKTGVNYVRNVVEKANCIFQKIDQENDLGIDGLIEFIQDEQPVNKQIAVQIKSGESRQKRGQFFMFDIYRGCCVCLSNIKN